MKKLLLFSSVIIASCENPNSRYTYRIEKDSVQRVVRVNDYPLSTHSDTVFVGAVWLTDSIIMHGDTVAYSNSDGSVVKIAPPFKIFRKKLQ